MGPAPEMLLWNWAQPAEPTVITDVSPELGRVSNLALLLVYIHSLATQQP